MPDHPIDGRHNARERLIGDPLQPANSLKFHPGLPSLGQGPAYAVVGDGVIQPAARPDPRGNQPGGSEAEEQAAEEEDQCGTAGRAGFDPPNSEPRDGCQEAQHNQRGSTLLPRKQGNSQYQNPGYSQGCESARNSFHFNG